uniref:Uncharacterized protein n=1 Tax=Rangifer tarandus platyrhynchus TaxID=3082113 RepID=A0ACB0DYD9_RANTA|nr:unnamed protein product [Rangifer tarandus platyrhynchus]
MHPVALLITFIVMRAHNHNESQFSHLFSEDIDHPSEVPEKLIQDRFRKLGRFPEAFSSIHYKGTRTYNPPTDFSGLRRALEQQLENNTTRSPRHPGVIFKALKGKLITSIDSKIGIYSGRKMELKSNLNKEGNQCGRLYTLVFYL